MKTIATESALFQSPDASRVFCYTPYLAHSFDGRLVASFDLGGPGIPGLPGPKSDQGDFGIGNQGKVYLSDNHGHTWRHAADLPMLHMRVFAAGKRLYLIGHSGRLLIAASDDNGETWTPPSLLDDTCGWHQSGCTIEHRDGRVFLVMEESPGNDTLIPRLMAADENADLLDRTNWTFSNGWDMRREVSFPQAVGMPFFPQGELLPGRTYDPRYSPSPTMLETNVLRLHDPDHLLFDPADRTFLLLGRLYGCQGNLAALLRGRELENGELRIDTFDTPAGAPFVIVPLPGGHLKFQIVYDQPSRLYWLLSSQSTDAMTRPERLPAERFNLPNNERRILVLHFSKNLFDWRFAGCIAAGATDKQSRHYASLLVDGDDLLVLSRSGDARAASAHNGNLITFHRISDFRTLAW